MLLRTIKLSAVALLAGLTQGACAFEVSEVSATCTEFYFTLSLLAAEVNNGAIATFSMSGSGVRGE